MGSLQPALFAWAGDGGDIGRTSTGDRKQRGHYPTPPDLVERVVEAVMPPVRAGETVTVLDPACGDGRFLAAAARWTAARGGSARVHGVELDAATADEARALLGASVGIVEARIDVDDALRRDWTAPGRGDVTYDVILGNPPYLSQLATATTRGGSSVRGGGPYADVAAEFLHLAVQLARPGGGRVGLVLPQSILASRDAGAIRAGVEREAERFWGWWSPRFLFDASVVVCALGFERRAAPSAAGPMGGNSAAGGNDRTPVWTDVVLAASGIPDLPELRSSGTIGDRADVSVDFRDCYYGLAAAVGEGGDGPRLVTSGLIDPGRCHWGERPTRFAKQAFAEPRIDLTRLARPMQRWAAAMAVPKVLVANQARVVECVVDADGTMLPSVPVLTVRPRAGLDPWALAAVLTSPVATLSAWRAAAGTGLSARSVRLSPRLVAALPWPSGDTTSAVEALRDGDVATCGRLVDAAFGVDDADRHDWWRRGLPGDGV